MSNGRLRLERRVEAPVGARKGFVDDLVNSFLDFVANGEVWAMATFKVKYCHKIFNFPFVRKTCCRLLEKAMQKYKIRYEKMGFDEDHVHIMLEMGLLSKPEIAKKLKGYSASKLLRLFPWLKKKYFWGSGLWNPAYDIRTHDPGIISRYIDKQKYAYAGQKTLTSF